MAGWLIYALGGGWGHLTRAVALAQAAERHAVRILTNSPYAEQVCQAVPALDIHLLSDRFSGEEAVRHIRRAKPDVLIVDTFPRGLGGELVNVLETLARTRILIHRDLDPEYVAQAKLHGFVESHYDLVIIPGEDEGGSFTGDVTRPWLVQGTGPPADPLGILVCASGTVEELEWYGAVIEILLRMGLRTYCVAPSRPRSCPAELWIQYWPAAHLYPRAEAVVGGAGYNTVYECLARGIPLVARPWPRLYDRQDRRAQLAARHGLVTLVQHPQEAAEAALRVRSKQHRALGRNGAGDAVTLVERSAII